MLSMLNAPFAMNGLEHQLLTEQFSDPKNVQRLLADPKTLRGLIAKLKALQALPPFKAKAGERLGIRHGVGFLYVIGPLFKRHDLITKFLGATTYEVLARDLQAALDHKEIHSIAIYIDSRGARPTAAMNWPPPFMRRAGKSPWRLTSPARGAAPHIGWPQRPGR